MKKEKGFTLIETLVSLALLGIIAATFLGGLANTSSARVTADQRVSAKIIAETIMEDIKKQPYSPDYDLEMPAGFPGYSANATVESIKNSNIQKITVAVSRNANELLTLESYKVKR